MERAITKIVGLFDRMPEVCMDPAVVHNDRDVVLINKSPKLTATQGIPQPDLESELADVSTKTRMDAINRLLKEQKIEVGRNANKDLIYRQVEAGKSAR